MEPVTKILRVIILHPKSIADAALEAYQREVEMVLTGYKMKSGEIAQPKVFLARDHFRAFQKKYGTPVNWRRWMEMLVEDPFDVYLIGPDASMGKATKDIVGLALRARKSVYYLDPDRVFQKVRGVTAVDPQDYQSGWIAVPA